MTNIELDKFKVDHLFLLIGENPLPNYVAARLMLKDEGIVYMVHTTKTFTRYTLLEKQLKKFSIKVISVSIGNAEADGYVIRKKIKEKIRHKGQPNGNLLLTGRVGLNYTGGTKAMSVHAYQAFIELGLTDCVFSYLDSRKLAMCIDDIQNKKTIPISVALSLLPQPSLEDVLSLHNLSWDKNNPPISKPLSPSAAVEFTKIYTLPDSEITKQWKNWCNQAFGQDTKDAKKRWKEDSQMPDLSKLKMSLGNSIEIPEPIKKVLREQLQCASSSEINMNIVKQQLRVNSLSQACQWLVNAGWLEDYVLSQVEKISTTYSIDKNTLAMSIHIQDPEKTWRSTDQFEFDVAFLRGYQLFAISCTTSFSHDHCKEKLFEAYVRARELGGDEARIALVCCYDYPTDQLKQELSLIIPKKGNKYDPKIEVFGRSDLEPTRFAKKLSAWIEKNIEEQENE
jgi:hypothetical protein